MMPVRFSNDKGYCTKSCPHIDVQMLRCRWNAPTGVLKRERLAGPMPRGHSLSLFTTTITRRGVAMDVR